MKSQTGFLSVPKSVTLSDREQLNDSHHALFHTKRQLWEQQQCSSGSLGFSNIWFTEDDASCLCGRQASCCICQRGRVVHTLQFCYTLSINNGWVFIALLLCMMINCKVWHVLDVDVLRPERKSGTSAVGLRRRRFRQQV